MFVRHLVVQGIAVPLQPVVNELDVRAVSENDPDLSKVMPRRKVVVAAPGAPEAPVSTWSLAKSVFAAYKDETPQLQKRVFDADWAHTKVERFIKDEAEMARVREVMRRHYYQIRCAYKYYCTLDSGGDPYSMSWNAFTTMMTTIGVPDEQCKLDVRSALLPLLLLFCCCCCCNVMGCYSLLMTYPA